MASEAINATSFISYITRLCTYYDGTALSEDHQNQLYFYLCQGEWLDSCLSIKEGMRILNKLIYLMTGSNKTVTITDGSDQNSALSLNTAKQLVDLKFTADLRKKFTTLAKWYPSTTFNSYNYKTQTFYLPSKSSVSLSGTIYGGGGGGQGGYTNGGDKGANYYTIAGRGAAGGTTTVKINGSQVGSASGGAISSTYTAGPSGGNPNWTRNGAAGNAGGNGTVNSATWNPSTSLVITPGNGGGGGGGIGITLNTDGTYQASNGSGTTGGKGYAKCSFSDDQALGCGGGAGGGGSTYGAYVNALGTQHVTPYNAEARTDGRGGRGGYSSGVSRNTIQPNTMGSAGYGGTAKRSDDTWDSANGGNGGNKGGFVVSASCTAANVLIIYR